MFESGQKVRLLRTSFFYMGPHFVDFTFTFDTTLIRLEMTEIWPKYVAQTFFPPSPESSAQDPPPLNRVKERSDNTLRIVKGDMEACNSLCHSNLEVVKEYPNC